MLAFAYSLGDRVKGYLGAEQQRDNSKGLTVVAQFYQDSMDALSKIVPWLFGELDKLDNPVIAHTLNTIVIGQFYDFTTMTERLSELRAVQPLSVTGNEHNLMNRLKALESRVLAAVEAAKNKGLRIVRNFPVMNAYYDKINAFLSAEFPKLNEAIGNLPSAALRQQTIQQLIIDLTHLTQIPFML
ncbi:unnamed protein product [Medioppia subpectinata]|uniref:Uncharacterized protein n=1 Tax=Medioppia subpectinata TaxID=1979941 RepID=A0A7R9KY51_9ACAR|nr:unnamed protein product [Medioppia subpectinata]CAG2111990.1 unnamed protein product [Medioppia subpectinata]